MGSNMAEAHPVGFQWVMEARERGAKIIHVDPRYTRTSAVADLHVPIRAGTDIAFLGGVVNYILQGEREFTEYVKAYTNARTIVGDDFRDTEDLDGIFSGLDREGREYDRASWQYEGMEAQPPGGEHGVGELERERSGDELKGGETPRVDETLQDPRCVFQLLKRHYARYTPEMVARICGCTEEQFEAVAEALCENSGRERTSAFAYAVGWTHHSVGVQYIRTSAIVQLLLGNIGRPGGGILALRGHASIQGSTDIPTLYNILPGYLPMPHAQPVSTLDDYIGRNRSQAGFWGNIDAYIVSLLKAWWGPAARRENDFCFDYLPRIDADHSHYRTVADMEDNKLEGYLVMGENPAVGSANSKLQRLALAKLKWLVVRDFSEIETANFWKDGPEIETGELVTEAIDTEVFLMPAATHTEKDGSFTNTQRLVQWHHKAVEPEGDCRSELHFVYHLGRRIRERLAGSERERDRPILDLTWDYPTVGPDDEPDAEAVLAEVGGFDAEREPLADYLPLKADGSTTSGCWIYAGQYADGVNQTARRKPGREQSWVAPEWAWAWPMNRRILYNRASADPEGKPWWERKRYIWWDGEEEKWVGEDIPDFTPTMAPDYVPEEGAAAQKALRGDEPFIMQADGRGWLYVPNGILDGPLPTHYEPHESPFDNPLYGQRANPVREEYRRRDNLYNPSGDEPGVRSYPYVMTTYRLTEHHTAGGMSRTLPYLSELQPEFFCEVSPELARERGLEHGGWATIVSARPAIEARVMVTDRIAPLKVDGRVVHQVGLPYHWGNRGISTGDSANDLFSIALDPNVHIQESKVATCDVEPGRRPRGSDLPVYVERRRREAGVDLESGVGGESEALD